MSSVYDGFLTSLVIEYVRLLFVLRSQSIFLYDFSAPVLATAVVVVVGVFVALPQTTLMYFQFCGFSFSLLPTLHGFFCTAKKLT